MLSNNKAKPPGPARLSAPTRNTAPTHPVEVGGILTLPPAYVKQNEFHTPD